MKHFSDKDVVYFLIIYLMNDCILNFLYENEVKELKSYLKFFVCKECHAVITDEFRFCGLCCKNLCGKCNCEFPEHVLKPFRQNIELTNKIRFHCKYCNKTLIYFELFRHSELCDKKDEWNSAINKHSIQGDKNNINLKFTNVTEVPLFEKVNKYFDERHKKLIAQVKDSISQSLFYTSLPLYYSKYNNYIKSIFSNEESLLEEKDYLQNKLNISLDSLQTLSQSDPLVLRTFIYSGHTAKKGDNMCIKCCVLSAIFLCDKCLCQLCEKCAKKCLKCGEFFCPQDGICCSLCDIKEYCKKCLVKCFNPECNNVFCIDCYEKNRHQERKKELDCRIVSCIVCGKKLCIMKSIIDQKTNRRICKKCYKKEK